VSRTLQQERIDLPGITRQQIRGLRLQGRPGNPPAPLIRQFFRAFRGWKSTLRFADFSEKHKNRAKSWPVVPGFRPFPRKT
jgi:hypothetical protein